MRKALAKDEGVRKRFSGIFTKIGRKTNFKGYREDTILLSQITDLESNEVVTDHVWFSYTKGFEAVRMKEGMTLEFEARVKKYAKGYVNKRNQINLQKTDYKLSHPTKIKIRR